MVTNVADPKPSSQPSTWDGKYCLIIALTLFVCGLFPIVLIQDSDLRSWTVNLITILYNLLACAGLYFAYRRTKKKNDPAAKAWLILSLAQLSYLSGDILYTVYQNMLGIDPYPSLADVFFILYFPLFLLGILHFPTPSQQTSKNLQTWLQVLILFIASGLFLRYFILNPILIENTAEDFLTTAVSVAYPLLDLLMVLAVLVLLFRQPGPSFPMPLLLLGLGAIVTIVTDTSYSYQALNESLVSGSLVDFGYIVSYILFFMAGMSQALKPYSTISSPSMGLSKSNTVRIFGHKFVHVVLPNLWLLASFGLLIFMAIPSAAAGFAQTSIWVTLLMILVVIVQLIDATDNINLTQKLQSLNEQLEERVIQRTQELAEANLALTTEISTRRRMEDILRQREDLLRQQAEYDALTGLPNRLQLTERLNLALSRYRRHLDSQCGLLFLDLDNFKVINDSLGHSAGDRLLIEIGQRLKKCVRANDLVARLSGDEFVILLEDLNGQEGAIQIARRVLELIHEPMTIEGQTINASVSIGVVINDLMQDAEGALRDADIAMYQAKSLGKNRFVIFEPGHRIDPLERLRLENDLRFALERNELFLVYQTVNDLTGGQIVGFEALLRWRHPERGVIAPLDFIPIAEDSGLIVPIGLWVLEQACRQMREWIDTWPDLPEAVISVNLSIRQLTQPDFVDRITEILKDTELDPSRLALELTESSIMENLDLASRVLEELNRLHIAVYLDGFGSGYSSLARLQRLPINTIKLNRAFTDGIRRDGTSTPILRALTVLGNELGLNVIAEGVEHEYHAGHLRNIGCHLGQGYYFSRPMEAGLIERRFNSGPDFAAYLPPKHIEAA